METFTETQTHHRKVSILLGIGIMFIPIIFAWFLLRKGHSTFSRALGFGWLLAVIGIGISGDNKPKKELTTHNVSVSASKSPLVQQDKVPVSAPVAPEKEFEKLLLNELGTLKPKWESIEITEASGSSYIVSINYKGSATFSGYGEISNDTKNVVRAALHVLMAQGRDPGKEWIFVRAHAHQPAGKGEAGAALTRVLGKSTYDFNTDKIEFEKPK